MKKNKINKFISIISAVLLIVCALLCGCSNGLQIKNISDLQNKVIAIEKDSVHGNAVIENIEGVEIIEKPSNGECISQLLTDKVDAVALDYLSAIDFMNQNKGLMLLSDKLNESEYGFGFNSDKSSVKDEFDGVLSDMKLSGSILEIVNKWTGDGEKPAPQQTYSGQRILTCEIDPDIAPICYKEGDEYLGIDIEILCYIGDELDYKIEFIENDFDDLVPSVIAKETDIIASGLTITEARAKRVSFTQGYLDASTVLLVLDRSVNNGTIGLFKSISNGFNSTFLNKSNSNALLSGVLMTLFLICSTLLIGLVLGTLLFIIGYFTNKTVFKVISEICRIFILLPLSTWLLVCYYLIFPVRSQMGYLVAIFGLSISFGFQVFACFKGAYDLVPKGQLEVAKTMGYSKAKTLTKIIIPQMASTFFSKLEIDGIYHVRDTSLVGFIAVQDIQAVADAISVQTAEPFFPIILTALVYMLLCLAVSLLLRLLAKRFNPARLDRNQLEKRAKKGVKND